MHKFQLCKLQFLLSFPEWSPIMFFLHIYLLHLTRCYLKYVHFAISTMALHLSRDLSHFVIVRSHGWRLQTRRPWSGDGVFGLGTGDGWGSGYQDVDWAVRVWASSGTVPSWFCHQMFAPIPSRHCQVSWIHCFCQEDWGEHFHWFSSPPMKTCLMHRCFFYCNERIAWCAHTFTCWRLMVYVHFSGIIIEMSICDSKIWHIRKNCCWCQNNSS